MSEVATEAKEVEVNQENVTDSPTNQGEPAKFDSLFGGDEDVSESELKGEEEPSEEKKPAGSESLDDETKPDGEGAEVKGEGAEVKPDDGIIKDPDLAGGEEELDKDPIQGKPVDGGEEKPDYSKPPPKGYVALPALQQERTNVQNLKADIATLQAQAEANAEVKPEGEAEQEEFKVLSDSGFEELLEEDPDAALLYERKLRQHEKTKADEEAVKFNQQIRENSEAKAVKGFVDEIQTAVPGVYDKGSDVMDKLVGHAEEYGFDPAYLNAMTNPAAKIIMPGDKKVFSMGKGAVSLVKLLNKSLTEKNSNNPETLRAKLTKEITAKVTKDLLNKFKNDATGFRSINDIPGDSGEIDNTREYSETDFADMTPEQEKKALGG